MLDALLIAFQGLVPPVALGQTQQTTGVIEGTVTDVTGAPLPGVTVTLFNTGTQFDKVVITNVEGAFQGVLLPFGSYRLTAELEGFSTLVRDNIELSLAHNTVGLHLTLQLAQTEQ